MAYEYKPGTFTLFPNDKGENDKRPDYRGGGKDLSGNAIEVAAWTRRGTQGKEFLSCTFKPKAEQQAKPEERAGGQTQDPKQAPAKMDDDLPW